MKRFMTARLRYHMMLLICLFCLKVIYQQRGLIPDEHAEYYLLDRVVNVGSNSCVPFGLRGTLTGILGGKTLAECLG